MTDSKYFTTTKKGEIFELKSELNSDKKEKKREAVKKVKVYKMILLSLLLIKYFTLKFNHNLNRIVLINCHCWLE